jgi:hypothetical protein
MLSLAGTFSDSVTSNLFIYQDASFGKPLFFFFFLTKGKPIDTAGAKEFYSLVNCT